jgi:hypothetical protein
VQTVISEMELLIIARLFIIDTKKMSMFDNNLIVNLLITLNYFGFDLNNTIITSMQSYLSRHIIIRKVSTIGPGTVIVAMDIRSTTIINTLPRRRCTIINHYYFHLLDNFVSSQLDNLNQHSCHN